MLRFNTKRAILFLFTFTLSGLAAACSPQPRAGVSETAVLGAETAVPQAGTAVVGSDVTVPHLEELVGAAASGSPQDLLPLVKFASLPCTKAEGLGGPPKCLSSEAEGTPVEVLPILSGEGTYLRRSDFGSWPGTAGAQLYAVYRTPKSASADQFFPAGDFGIAFIPPDETKVLVFQVTQDGIVRLDYYPQPSFENILKDSEVVLGPYPVVR